MEGRVCQTPQSTAVESEQPWLVATWKPPPATPEDPLLDVCTQLSLLVPWSLTAGKPKSLIPGQRQFSRESSNPRAPGSPMEACLPLCRACRLCQSPTYLGRSLGFPSNSQTTEGHRLQEGLSALRFFSSNRRPGVNLPTGPGCYGGFCRGFPRPCSSRSTKPPPTWPGSPSLPISSSH